MKIVKRFISAFEDKKAFDSGINLLMRKDAVFSGDIFRFWNH